MINKIQELLMKLWRFIVKICRRIALPRKYCFYIEAELSGHCYKRTMTDTRFVSKSLITEKIIEYLTIMTKGSVIVHDSPDGYKVVVISENDIEMIGTYKEKLVSEDEKSIYAWLDFYVDEDRFNKENKNESK